MVTPLHASAHHSAKQALVRILRRQWHVARGKQGPHIYNQQGGQSYKNALEGEGRLSRPASTVRVLGGEMKRPQMLAFAFAA